MKLTELNPSFVGSGGPGITDSKGGPVPRRDGVGLSCDCPCGCGEPLYVAFDIPLDGKGPPLNARQPLWGRQGDTFEDLTLTPSIQRMDGCKWHGHLRDGEFVEC